MRALLIGSVSSKRADTTQLPREITGWEPSKEVWLGTHERFIQPVETHRGGLGAGGQLSLHSTASTRYQLAITSYGRALTTYVLPSDSALLPSSLTWILPSIFSLSPPIFCLLALFVPCTLLPDRQASSEHTDLQEQFVLLLDRLCHSGNKGLQRSEYIVSRTITGSSHDLSVKLVILLS